MRQDLTHANTENEHYEDDARHSLLFEKPMTYIIKEKNNKTNPWVLQIGPKQNRHRKNFSSIKECQKARLEWVLKNKGSSAFKTASENFDSQQAEDEHRDRDRKRARLSPPTARAGISHAMEDEKEEEDNECQHDLGLEYGALAPEIAADNMAREMANAQLKSMMELSFKLANCHQTMRSASSWAPLAPAKLCCSRAASLIRNRITLGRPISPLRRRSMNPLKLLI